MDQKTLDAFDKSIEHWERLANGTSYPSEGIGSNDCSICEIYCYQIGATCLGCPIFKDTGRILCKNTPHNEVAVVRQRLYIIEKNIRNNHLDIMLAVKTNEEFKGAAKKELDYLISLKKKLETQDNE